MIEREKEGGGFQEKKKGDSLIKKRSLLSSNPILLPLTANGETCSTTLVMVQRHRQSHHQALTRSPNKDNEETYFIKSNFSINII